MNSPINHNNITLNYNQQNYGDINSYTILFIHGLFSDMKGSKSIAIDEYCKKKKLNFVAFDNAGHGESSGEFSKMNISTWIDCTKKIINELKLDNIIIIGSSKGGWISLLISLMNDKRIKGQILLAPAPDFTEFIYKNISNQEKVNLQNNIPVMILKSDKFEGIPISKQLIDDGKKYLLLNKDNINITIPTIIIQGMLDDAVHYSRSLILNEKIQSPYLSLKLLKSSGHKLSSNEDMINIFNSIDEVIKINLF